MEYTVLACKRVSVSYLMDLYALYLGKDTTLVPPVPVKSVVTLNVEKIIDPEKWLNCIKWARYQNQHTKLSLEWFIARPKNSGFYYSVGEDGSLLMPRNSYLNTIQIHPETVKTISGKSVRYCSKPTLCVVDA